MSNLVIVESPGKTKTIKGYLGTGYNVMASIGHVRDLPKSALGVDIEHGFTAKYINIRDKSELINSLRRAAKEADIVYLATDPDREGEAISWHLLNVLDCPDNKIRRVTFNEITKNAVRNGIENPRGIDMALVNSQQARRILDRIVGYKISPFLWHTVRSGLSAGRVQSVATRIVVDREDEIRAFVPEEYWKIDANLQGKSGKPFIAHFYGICGHKTAISVKEEADDVYNGSLKEPFIVKSIKRSAKTRSPQPPFTTSTLLQEASRKLNLRAGKTMKIAQELYEGINLGEALGGTQGIITYMRTDSLRISDEAIAGVRDYIKDSYGEANLPSKPRVFKTNASAQDAHEAIRPSGMKFVPEAIKGFLSSEQYKLYKLIWERFVASQMEAAVYDAVSVEISAGNYDYRATGSTVKFKGFLSVYEEGEDEKKEKEAALPPLAEGETLKLLELMREQKFTEPPARYTEATLIKFLEEQGIGRPSTIPPTITTIIDRGYVDRDGKSLAPTQLGEITVGLMKDCFPEIIDYKFTAGMERSLDEVATGTASEQEVLQRFWDSFSKSLEEAEKKTSGQKGAYTEKTDIVCELCGETMIIKNGRFGKFAACPNYPKCKNTKRLDKNGKVIEASPDSEPVKTDMVCELCGGAMVKRNGRFGEFYSCENFPRCRNSKTAESKATAVCPLCGGTVIQKHSRKGAFWSCSNYPTCKFSTSYTPTDDKCPDCGGSMFEKRDGTKVCLKCKGK